MPLYEISAAPQFITKYSSLDEVRAGLLSEYDAILRYLLTTQVELGMIIWSTSSEEKCHFAYEIDEPATHAIEYLSAHERILRLEPAQDAYAEWPVAALHRAVDLVPVGSIDRAQGGGLPVLPPDARRFTNFDPNVVGQSTLSQVVFAPLTQMAGALVRDRFTPDIAYLAPIPRHLELAQGRNFMWKSTLRVLSQGAGRIRIACRPYSYSDADIEYALLCLEYYLGTHAARLSTAEVDIQTHTLRSISTRQPMFEVNIRVWCEDEGLQRAFLQDTDGEAFVLAPTELEQALVNRGSSAELGRRERPAPAGRRANNESPARQYGKLFELEELCRIMLPPFTLKDALPGVAHFVPRPFQEPHLPPLIVKAKVNLGSRNGGGLVDVALEQIARHVFITGASGTGKTNSLIHLIRQLHGNEVPVLIIDPAKRDFEPLMRSLGLKKRIFDFASSWVRFNPFIPPPGIPLYAHAVVLAKTLAMLFPTNAVAYEILLSLVKDAYWKKLESGRPRNKPLTMEFFSQKTGADLRSHPHLAPTFDEFLDSGLSSLEEAARKSTGQFAREAFEHFERRWSNLRRSLLSIALRPPSPAQSIDPLFMETGLIELGGWFDQDEANAMFALVFSMLYEQRLSDAVAAEGNVQGLAHVAVLDEAHRIVPADTEGGDGALVSAASQAAHLLSQMIAECRALGQGLILAEQSAGNISPQVLINTSTKIVHSVFFGRDKEFLRSALSLSNEEEDFLAYLEVGEALAFTGRAYQPILVKVPRHL